MVNVKLACCNGRCEESSTDEGCGGFSGVPDGDGAIISSTQNRVVLNVIGVNFVNIELPVWCNDGKRGSHNSSIVAVYVVIRGDKKLIPIAMSVPAHITYHRVCVLEIFLSSCCCCCCG